MIWGSKIDKQAGHLLLNRQFYCMKCIKNLCSSDLPLMCAIIVYFNQKTDRKFKKIENFYNGIILCPLKKKLSTRKTSKDFHAATSNQFISLGVAFILPWRAALRRKRARWSRVGKNPSPSLLPTTFLAKQLIFFFIRRWNVLLCGFWLEKKEEKYCIHFLGWSRYIFISFCFSSLVNMTPNGF